ncbi:radical SAM protein [uncultured Desulfobacter sp.]|uniref:B12-binding domain-containing radical SAM protein n=1 Tax=uncultured Desulfobacter sp. TaxID=240139 RepID=UPI002AAB8359|nr:radical SAM protein [uncultured Desulfobacter sp.]
MKVFLGNAPWKKPGFYGVRAGSRWPHFEADGCTYMPFPFFLAYATSLIEKDGFTPLLVDAIAEGMDDETFFDRITSFGPDIIFFEISSASLNTDLRILHHVRKLVGEDVKIIFAGAHQDLGTSNFLSDKPELDFTLGGEYEFPLLSLIQAIRDRSPMESVPGLVWRDNKGDVHTNPRGALHANLDDFPWPSRDMLPMVRYNDRPGGIPAPSLQVLASRGCPFGCVFCAWPQLMYGGNSYRTRSPKDIVDEIEDCVKKFGFRSFYFDDDTFNVGKKRIMALCQEIKARSLNLPWAIMARADHMDRELLETLKDAGLHALKYGVESGAQQILDSACKGLDLDKVAETIRITRELGIQYHLTFMFGLPGETEETARQTMALALDLDPDSLQFSIATPFPGSRFYDMLVNKGHLLSTNPDEYDGYHNAVVRTDALTHTDLVALRNEAESMWKEHCRQRRARG